ncbi:MAG: class I SAM-dependent methyltransferase [Deltaproteobacteria bacterium]|nr:class I SAM-dependent methyltransferase [Deltaproteobacteria bacterium]
MPFFSESRFPRLWDIFQFWMGGTVDKRKLAKRKWTTQHRHVLEIGCATGNVAKAFFSDPSVSYTGIDIDCGAIFVANRRYGRRSNIRFICEAVELFAKSGAVFDYILYCGVLHHNDAATCLSLLAASQSLSKDGTDVIILEPLLPEPTDKPVVHFYSFLEQGRFLGSARRLCSFLSDISFLRVVDMEIHPVGATPFRSWPTCARFALIHCRVAKPEI